MQNRDRVLGKRILLAEDQSDVRQVLALLLQVDQHRVTLTANGREALDRFTREPFDLVITDLAMPEMNGDELARRIKQIAPAQPILMITASADDLDNCANLLDGILRKPFTIADLRRDIARTTASPAPQPAQVPCQA